MTREAQKGEKEKRERERKEAAKCNISARLSIFMCVDVIARERCGFNLLFRIVCLAVNRVLFESALKGSLNHHGHFRLLPANFAELPSPEFPQILKLAAVPDARRILRPSLLVEKTRTERERERKRGM